MEDRYICNIRHNIGFYKETANRAYDIFNGLSQYAGYMLRHRLIGIVLCAVVLIVISVFSVRMVMANDKTSGSIQGNRYYTSIDIKKNDTLWGIAKQYAQEGTDIQGYIKEIKSINRLSDDNITQGQHLVVYYYSDEIK